MNIKNFLQLVGQPGRTNIFVVCPDELGLLTLLPSQLRKVAKDEDVQFINAANLTKDKARKVEKEARLAPRAGSDLNHFFIYSMQNLQSDCVGPLLKAVEESTFSRFIFQAQYTPNKVYTLMSRSSVIQLPFLAKKMVLTNLGLMNYDVKAVEQFGLYDGTLGGTVKALGMKDALASIRRDLARGTKGLAALFAPEVVNSNAFYQAVEPLLSQEEEEYLKREDTPERRKLALLLIAGRQG